MVGRVALRRQTRWRFDRAGLDGRFDEACWFLVKNMKVSDLESIFRQGIWSHCRGWRVGLTTLVMAGCASTGIEALPATSPARPDAPVTPVASVGRVLRDADPLAWPPLRPAVGGHHNHGAHSQPVGPGSQPVGPGSQPVGPGSQPVGPGSQPVGPGSQPVGPELQPVGPGSQPPPQAPASHLEGH